MFEGKRTLMLIHVYGAPTRRSVSDWRASAPVGERAAGGAGRLGSRA